jgi:hypothetical protein
MGYPHIFRIGALVLATTALYTYVGQMVPPEGGAASCGRGLGSEMTTADMVKVGRPDHERQGPLPHVSHDRQDGGTSLPPTSRGGGAREHPRRGPERCRVLLPQSLYEPTAYVVEGFPPAMRP